jgi:hypothetical protein
MHRVPAWKDDQFLALLKLALLSLRKDQLKRLYEDCSAAPTQSSSCLAEGDSMRPMHEA